MKRFAFILMAALLLAPAALSCPDDQRILKISGPTNAHAELYDGTNYATEICYDTIFGLPYAGAVPHGCTGSNTVLKLSDATNAHVEEATESNYNNPANYVCFGNLECGYVASGGLGSPACASWQPGARCIATISAATNAHVSAVCNGAGSYPIAVCCKLGLVSNVAPVANAGSNQAALSGVSVSLNGSCTDSDGTVSDCDWGFVPPGCSFAGVQTKAGLGTANASSAVDVSCIGAVGASFALTLAATDNDGGTGSDAMLVTILAPGSEPYLRLTKVYVLPGSFPASPPPDFTALDIAVKNFGQTTDAVIKVKVFEAIDFFMGGGTELALAQVACPSLGTNATCENSLEAIDVLSLMPGSYKLVVETYDGNGVLHDSESVFFVVGEQISVPELSLLLLPLIAFAVIVFLFYAGRKRSKGAKLLKNSSKKKPKKGIKNSSKKIPKKRHKK